MEERIKGIILGQAINITCQKWIKENKNWLQQQEEFTKEVQQTHQLLLKQHT